MMNDTQEATSNLDRRLAEVVSVHRSDDVVSVIICARNFARALGFDEWKVAELMTAASELATNIIKYGIGGSMVFRRETDQGSASIVIEAIDRGPGIADWALATTDHHSSSGTLGLGLPSVCRIMDSCELDQDYAQGCRIVAKMGVKRADS